MNSQRDDFKNLWIALVIGVLAFGALLRLWGIQHELPYSYYSDEVHLVKRALAYGTGDLNPHWFNKPAFFSYLLFAEYCLMFLGGLLLGVWSSPEDFAVFYLRNPGPFYVVGRLTTVAFSIGTVWLVYRIGRRHFSAAAGVLSALFLALTCGHISSSQVVKGDIPCTFFSMLSMYCMLNFIQRRKRGDLLLACLAAGFGTAIKYYTFILVVPIVMAAFLWKREEANWRLAWASRAKLLLTGFLVFAGTYFVCSPFNLLDKEGRRSLLQKTHIVVEAAEDLTGNEPSADDVFFEARTLGVLDGAIDYARKLFSPMAMGPVLAPLGILGLVLLPLMRRQANFIFVAPPIFLIGVSIVVVPGFAEIRHQAPLFPFLSIAGAAFVVWLSGLGVPRWLIAGILGIGLLHPLIVISDRAQTLSKPDTRNAAKLWIEENLISGTTILLSENGPPLNKCQQTIQREIDSILREVESPVTVKRSVSRLQYEMLAADNNCFDVVQLCVPWWREEFHVPGVHRLNDAEDRRYSSPAQPVGVESYDYYVENGFQYAVVLGDQFAAANSRSRDRFPTFAAFYDDLAQHGFLLKEFHANDRLNGPMVRIYRFTPRSE